MAKKIEFEGKVHSFPDGVTGQEISEALKTTAVQTNKEFKEENDLMDNGFFLTGIGIVILIFGSYFLIKKISFDKFNQLISITRPLLLFILVLILLWMFRFEATEYRSNQCLDRWQGKLVYCR